MLGGLALACTTGLAPPTLNLICFSCLEITIPQVPPWPRTMML